MSGTVPFLRLLRALSRSEESRTSPLMAFFKSLREFLMTFVRPLNRSNSYVKTVFILCSYEIGYFASAAFTSNCAGNSSNMESASLLIRSSSFPPPPPPEVDWVIKMLSSA